MAQILNETLSGAGPQDSDEIDWPGGPGCFICQGSFTNNATFQLRYTLDTGTMPTWSDVPGAEMTIMKDDIGMFQLPPCRLIVHWEEGDSQTTVKVRIAPAWQGWFNDPALPSTS